MGRGLKVGIGVAVVLVVLIAVNAFVVAGATEPAGVTVPNGRILDLPDGEIQAVEGGPRSGDPIVLIHCFSCAIDWWDQMRPLLEAEHRVVAVDLLGHGGSEKPGSGYTPENQAKLVAEAMEELGVSGAEVVGHSLGGSVAVALAEQSPDLVDRVVIVDTPPDRSRVSLGFIAGLAFQPVIGEALWTIKPDFSVRQGLEVAFAPGFDVPDAFVDDVNRMTYTSYDESPSSSEDFAEEKPLDERMRDTGLPLLVIMGAEEQIIDGPAEALAEYRQTYPRTKTTLIQGAGHSPNVEKPAQTAALVLAFGNAARVRGKVAKATGSP
ncbi:MAG TPA: alpha/beta hydrolase [Solirubrobacterales bacterium]|nr:alpha/beta hydrolase [Solirubrobacterales bacterium]